MLTLESILSIIIGAGRYAIYHEGRTTPFFRLGCSTTAGLEFSLFIHR